MEVPAPVAARIDRLASDQREAATAPPGPILCVAPAGSGKTTTLVARTAWLVGGGMPAETIRAITFNRRAAEELASRIDEALEPLGVAAGSVAVRTFHALGREILVDAECAVDRLADREAVLRQVAPWADPPALRRLDTFVSRMKVELGVSWRDVAADPTAGPMARAFAAYGARLEADGSLDFDDLVLRAVAALQADSQLLARWRRRCAELLVDEVQDVDRAQLGLALLLAAPANRIFLVGDDDQSIYGWRLADVRRVLGLAQALPGLRRIDLIVNYRCPAPVVDRAIRLVEHNRERFAKAIRARPGASGRLIVAPDAADEPARLRRVMSSWPNDESSRAVLARTNRELLPALVVALELDIPFRAPAIELLLESPLVDEALAVAADPALVGLPLLVALARVRASAPSPEHDSVAAAMLAWAAPYPELGRFRTAVATARSRLASLRRDDAALTLATAHATKGLEFDHVAVIGMEIGRFPSRRSVAEAEDPRRALEEERRLAYVAWTRARVSLTLVYDPAAPSAFLLEAFEPDELALASGGSSR